MLQLKKYKLKDICIKIGSGATPKGGKESYVSEGIALIRSQNVLDFSFSTDGLAFITDIQAFQLANVIVEKGDVLLNITGDSVARVCQVPNNILPARVNQHVAIIRPDKKKLNPTYLKYYLLNPSFKNYLLGLAAAGATRNALTKAMIEDLEIFLPELIIQDQIVDVLSSLDEKILLNQQINQTLESIAQALFKHWFIDFEFPNENGNPYKSSGGLMEESSLGVKPKGWNEINIGKLFEFTTGGDWGKEIQSEEYPIQSSIIRGTDFEELLQGNYDCVPVRFIKSTNFNKRKIQHGDILLEISGGSKDQPTGRNILITQEIIDIYNGKVIPASFCRLIRTTNKHISYYLSLYLQKLYEDGKTWEYQNQSTGISNFQFTYFSEKEKLNFPNDNKILFGFTLIIEPIIDKINSNNSQVYTLRALRNTLLPRLMNVELIATEVENLNV